MKTIKIEDKDKQFLEETAKSLGVSVSVVVSSLVKMSTEPTISKNPICCCNGRTVVDEFGKEYASITMAANAIGAKRQHLGRAMKNGVPYRGVRYWIKDEQ